MDRLCSKSPRDAAIAGESAPAGPFLRAFEVTVAVALLVLTAPILLVIAVWVRLDSKGPAIFRQIRIGHDLRPFVLYKFRTLHVDARERHPELYRYQYSPDELQTLQFKVENDPRLTRVGRWLRRTSLDELPNFFNVIRGDMALVGPRPEIPEMLRYYEGEMREMFSVRPGVTGLSQVSGRGNLTFHEAVALDVHYARNRSLGLDLKILAQTVRKCITGEGAF